MKGLIGKYVSNIVVVGSQWGDEGKGKIVDYLSENADVIVRFQGGHNAGHTLVINGKTYKLSILPSGIVRQDKISVIGNGVVIDPWALLDEIEAIKKTGIKISSENLKISNSAPLILPIHSQIDKVREIQRGDSKIGTTGRGIGPAYEDKVARRAIRVSDLKDKSLLKEKVNKLLNHHNIWLKAQNFETLDSENITLWAGFLLVGLFALIGPAPGLRLFLTIVCASALAKLIGCPAYPASTIGIAVFCTAFLFAASATTSAFKDFLPPPSKASATVVINLAFDIVTS